MQRTLIKELGSKSGKTVHICGWLGTLRDQKRIQFLIVRDHTGSAQVIHEKSTNAELAAIIAGLTSESAVEIVGKAILNPTVKLGGMEVVAESVNVVSKADVLLPLGENPNIETRLDWRFLGDFWICVPRRTCSSSKSRRQPNTLCVRSGHQKGSSKCTLRSSWAVRANRVPSSSR